MSAIYPEAGITRSPNAILWRYMELDRFKSFLERRALFFCRAGKFADPFEGSIPQKEYDHRVIEQKNMGIFYGNMPADEQVSKNIASITSWHLEFRQTHIINCWHNNVNESDAMWQLYLKSNEGVAIQTNVERLVKSLENSPHRIEISQVRYLDYEKEIFYHKTDFPNMGYNLLTPLIHKRIEFEHEREVRLIHEVAGAAEENYWLNQEFENGTFVETDVDVLVEKIILHPTSDERTRKIVEAMIQNSGFEFNLEASLLSKPPLF